MRQLLSAREKAAHAAARPVSYAAAVVIVLVWLLLAALLIHWLRRLASF